MKAVSNSSVLIALSTIGQLSLLLQRFSEGIIIPTAVWQEVVETGGGRSGSQEVSSVSWIEVCEVKNQEMISILSMELDRGEAEAIALASEQQINTILLDEKSARRVARRLNLGVLGTVGILIWAKKIGLVINLQEQLDALQSQGKFRLSHLVYEEALKSAGEVTS